MGTVLNCPKLIKYCSNPTKVDKSWGVPDYPEHPDFNNKLFHYLHLSITPLDIPVALSICLIENFSIFFN